MVRCFVLFSTICRPCEYFHRLILVCKIAGGSLFYLSWAHRGELKPPVMNKLLTLIPSASWSFYSADIVSLAADVYDLWGLHCRLNSFSSLRAFLSHFTLFCSDIQSETPASCFYLRLCFLILLHLVLLFIMWPCFALYASSDKFGVWISALGFTLEL